MKIKSPVGQVTTTQRTVIKAGTGKAHQLLNRSDQVVTYLEMGNRAPGEEVDYPNEDLKIGTAPDGRRFWAHKDGTPY